MSENERKQDEELFHWILFHSDRSWDAEVMSSKDMSRWYSWLGSGQCMIIQGSWKVLKYPKQFMSMCTLKTIEICCLCVYTLNCIVFMLAEVLSVSWSVTFWSLSAWQCQQWSRIWQSKVEAVSGLLIWRCGRVLEQSSTAQGCTNSEAGALLGNTGTTLRLQPLPLTEVLLLCAFPRLCFDVPWKQ